jgi:DeoR/GlpR family transcriptional regulator of sugar metabolism
MGETMGDSPKSSETDQSSAPAVSKNQKAAQRREKIIEYVRDRKFVSFDDLIAEFGVKEPALYKDGKYFQTNGIAVTISDRKFIPGPERGTTIGRREAVHVLEKEMLGAISVDLVLSPENIPTHIADPDAPIVSEMYLPGSHITLALDTKLMAFWQQPHRTLVIDAGSSNKIICSQIEAEPIPAVNRHITMLRVVTNGLAIAHLFSQSKRKRQYELLTVGGAWHYDTDATSGLLAELCWKSFSLRPDIAIIGATAIDPDRGACCDTPEEAQIKMSMLSSARIRCISADSSKLLQPTGGASVFASFSSNELDCIITDWKINSQDKPALAFLSMARQRGISIIVSSDPKAVNRQKQSAAARD